MTKSQREYLIVGALVVIFLAVLVNSLHVVSRRRKAHFDSKGLNILLEGRPHAEGPANAESISWGRDPFVGGFLSSGEEGSIGLLLSGITYDADAPMCVINGEILRKGEMIDGFEVSEITEKAVTVKRDERDYHLKLFGE